MLVTLPQCPQHPVPPCFRSKHPVLSLRMSPKHPVPTNTLSLHLFAQTPCPPPHVTPGGGQCPPFTLKASRWETTSACLLFVQQLVNLESNMIWCTRDMSFKQFSSMCTGQNNEESGCTCTNHLVSNPNLIAWIISFILPIIVSSSRFLQTHFRGLKNTPLKVQKASFQKVLRWGYFSPNLKSRKCRKWWGF